MRAVSYTHLDVYKRQLMASIYSDIQSGNLRESNQFPGYELQEEG